MPIGILALIAASALFAQPARAPTPQPSCGRIESSPGANDGPSYDVFMIFFDYGSSAIRPDAAAILANAARTYRPLSHCALVVAAHTDRSGPDAYNLALSERRAQAVVAHLRRLGVTATSHVEPFGETRPLVDTPDGVAEPQNRRAEIVIAPPGR